MAIKAVFTSTTPDTLERITKPNDYNKEKCRLDINYTSRKHYNSLQRSSFLEEIYLI